MLLLYCCFVGCGFGFILGLFVILCWKNTAKILSTRQGREAFGLLMDCILFGYWIHPSGGGDGHPVQRMGIHRIYTVCFENIQLIALVGGRVIDSIAISIINFR